jgi:hypothetical protein
VPIARAISRKDSGRAAALNTRSTRSANRRVRPLDRFITELL